VVQTLLCPVHAATEWSHRAAESDSARHGARTAEGVWHAGKILGGEVVTTAVFLLNRAPTKALNDNTPFEAYHGRKLAVG
jgi:hypothetical protein